MRPPRVRTHSFPPSIRRIYTSGPCSCRASSCFADLPTFVCLMRFLFVGSVVCRRLPSAHVSRRRPCLWLCAWRYLLHSGLAPIRTRSCRAHKEGRRREGPSDGLTTQRLPDSLGAGNNLLLEHVLQARFNRGRRTFFVAPFVTRVEPEVEVAARSVDTQLGAYLHGIGEGVVVGALGTGKLHLAVDVAITDGRYHRERERRRNLQTGSRFEVLSLNLARGW